jgi:hypothetical protein
MALTQILSDGIANGAITTQQLAPGAAGGPKITQIQITNSGGTVLDDTAVSTSGGYIKITGTGFSAGAQVIINNTPATSTTFTSTTVLNAQVGPAVAGTYVVYVVNTDGGVAIAVNGLTYSAEPIWVTGSTLPNGTTGSAINIQLSATDATSYVLQEGSSLPDGLTLTSGGLLSGTVTIGAETTYSFTVIAIDNELQDSPRTFSITITAGDPYFYLTTLLLPGNGTNNQNNNVFLDSSNNNFAITRFGNATQGTFSPFSQTGWSNYFDGSGDYLAASNQISNFGTDDFTIECWVYKTGTTTFVLSNQDGGTNNNYFALEAVNANVTLQIRDNSSQAFAYGPAMANNTWTHIAATRSSNSVKVFVNGVSGNAVTISKSITSRQCIIGGFLYTGFETYFGGYISNLRVVKGTAVYTANFTPPTAPLTAITNTSLLTCQSNRFIDNSTNNFTIAQFGDTSVQAFSPFNPTSAWSAATYGGSGYFDGSGDYLTIPDSAQFTLGTNNFTVEGWIYNGTTGARRFICGQSNSSGQNTSIPFNVNKTSANKLGFSVNNSSGTNYLATSTNNLPLNAWTHFACVRDGNTLRNYINGVQDGTADVTGVSVTDSSNLFGIGALGEFTSDFWLGYISGLRFINGTCLYPSGTTFTPPTAPVTAIANTSLLLNFTNGQITDATSKNNLETVGDAKISTVQSKFGGSSMFFDGSGDYLLVPNNNLLIMGSESFTIEFWWYPTSLAGFQTLFDKGYTQSGALVMQTGNSDGRIVVAVSGSTVITSSTGASINTWTHVALVRNQTTMTLYYNGSSVGSVSNSTNFNNTSNVGIGANATAPSGGSVGQFPIIGYLDDLRITKGYARYTTNFTPPTSAFPTL